MRPLTAALAWLMLASVGCPAPTRFPAPDLQVSTDEATVARGEYLAQHVAICIECHSPRQWEYYGGPAAVGTEGQGGTSFVEIYKVPSDVVMPAPNITPTALGHWSDGEVFRAITGGLDDEGEALFPSMPFNQYRDMAQPDLEAIVAYLRTLPPLPLVQPERDLKYRLLQDITNTFPMKPVIRDTAPQLGDRGYGAYIARIASCRWCHTPSDAGGWPIAGLDYSGGTGFTVPPPGGGTAYAPNITRDVATGIGGWTKEVFIARFRGTTPDAVRTNHVAPGAFNSFMAWSAYSGMTEEDLGALYDHLMSKPGIRKVVPRWSPPE